MFSITLLFSLGIENFRRALKFEMGVKIDSRRLRQIMNQVRTFNIFIRQRHKVPTRAYRIAGSNEIWQSDIAVMYSTPSEQFRYIFVTIDVFNHFLRVKSMKLKSKESSVQAFKEILSESLQKPRVLEVDNGGEYNATIFQNLCQEEGIRLKFKAGRHKASERSIQ